CPFSVLEMSNKQEFEVMPREIFIRGIRNRCPNCGGKTLFRERGLALNESCSQCGMEFERGEGFFLGSMTLNYILTAFILMPPVLVLALMTDVPAIATIIVAIIGSFAVPIALYRPSRSWWLMSYFYFL